ncbi:MAG: CPBP family intramembrane metalloprotease [Ruminococcaceae bacterium]|nr:CPBP family intramembrane metalloprotease [Oscillospiraceae bacterium]
MNKPVFRPDPATGRLSEKNSKKYFSIIGLALFAFVVASYASSIGVAYLFAKFAPHLYHNFWVNTVISLVCQYGIGLGASLIILSRLPKDTNPSEDFGAKSFFMALCVVFAFMWAGNFVGNYVTSMLRFLLNRPVQNPVAVMIDGNAWWMNLLVYAILFPIIEEVVFRKIFCDRLLPLGEGYAVFVSAGIFGLVHGNFHQFFYAFAVGIIFAGIYIKTGRIRYSVIYHMIINSTGAVLLPVIYGKIAHLLSTEKLTELLNGITSSDVAQRTAAAAELSPVMGWLIAYWLYSIATLVLTILGVVFFFKRMRKNRLREGLIPPSKDGKVANIFCNVGAALAISVSVVIFTLSLF